MILMQQPAKLKVANKKRQRASDRFTVATWNCNHISHQKMEAVIGDNHDMMALTELWDRPKESWELSIKYPGRVFCSEPTDSTDPAAGAAVILSKRMAIRLITWKAEGTRFVWVRLEGQFYNILFISAYIPHKTKENPTQSQSLSALETLCHTLQAKYPDDQLLIGMDANAKVARSQLPYVGKYMMHYQNDSGGDRLMELMQNTNLVAASTHFASPKSQSLGQATYTKNGLPGQIDYILCSRKHMGNMGRCRVLWNRSLDAHAEKIDHGLIRMFIRFRIKVHRKLPDSERNFNRAALKSDENRELLNQAYISAREEYDQQFPALPQLNAPRVTTPVGKNSSQAENRILEYPNASPGTMRHTPSIPSEHPNRPQKSPQTSQSDAPRETTPVYYRQIISENRFLVLSGISQRQPWDHAAYLKHPGATLEPPLQSPHQADPPRF